MRLRQFVMARIEKVPQDPIQVEIHKPGTRIQEKRPEHEHLLEGNQFRFEVDQQFFLGFRPAVDATAAKLALLVPKERQPIRWRDELAPVDIVQLEAEPFDLAFDVAPEDGLHPFQFPREKAELEFPIEVLRDNL